MRHLIYFSWLRNEESPNRLGCTARSSGARRGNADAGEDHRCITGLALDVSIGGDARVGYPIYFFWLQSLRGVGGPKRKKPPAETGGVNAVIRGPSGDAETV